MNETIQAPVKIGSLSINGFMLPDGSYGMSIQQVAEFAGTQPKDVAAFLTARKQHIKQDLIESGAFGFQYVSVQNERIPIVDLKQVAYYWMFQAFALENRTAQKLVDELASNQELEVSEELL